MTKTVYLATDPAGIMHKRTTENRHYTHTVVVSGGYQAALANARSKGWATTDAHNFEWYKRTAEGRDPYLPSVRYRAKNPDKWTTAEIAEEDLELQVRDAAKVAVAKLHVEGHNVASYVAKQLALRVGIVEVRKAKGEFDAWWNAGWCGRRDLADKLAAAKAGADYVVRVLNAFEQA